MRGLISICAAAAVLAVASCSGAPAFAQEVPCVPKDIAIQRLEAAGLKVLGEGHARFTENDLIYVEQNGLVIALTVVKGCVIPETLIVGAFKAEFDA